jgi:hypothetical protein
MAPAQYPHSSANKLTQTDLIILYGGHLPKESKIGAPDHMTVSQIQKQKVKGTTVIWSGACTN